MIFAQMNRDYLKEEYMESLIENTKLKEQYVMPTTNAIKKVCHEAKKLKEK